MPPDFTTIDQLKAEWDRSLPLPPENHSRLWQKLRLDWNYNSNHIEGNLLTYSEAELLLLHGSTSGGHPVRHYEEMKAHDACIELVLKLAADPAWLLGESEMRQFNRMLLIEPFWKSVLAEDGRTGSKQILPGSYKTSPNNVRTSTGEIFQFASPEDTPARMQELVTWMQSELEMPTVHPVDFLARLHHDFVLIHPFDDGNGRVARLLINYVLLRLSYPPIIIQSADKANYLAALRTADEGDLPALAKYLAQQMEWALNLGLRAAKGESLEEPSDLEKEVAAFIRNQKSAREVKLKSPEVLDELFKISWRDVCARFEQKVSQLQPLFDKHSVKTALGDGDWQQAFLKACRNNHAEFHLIVELSGYNGKASKPFDLSGMLSFKFQEADYTVVANGKESRHSYSEPILSDEANSIASHVLRTLFDTIKSRSTQFS